MDAVTLARWQFGITTVYHFFFVPITIGLTWCIAYMQTKYNKTGDKDWLRLTKFFGNLLLINFAAGVVTGIVQEFQFGMNWSEYSRFVGDIFGAPLALEALIAFFLESTFIGLWVFGWNKFKPAIHNAFMYIVALASTLSAVFILAANSFMQNPVGARYNEVTGRAELTSFMDLLTNSFFIGAFTHVIGASFMTAGGIIAGVAGWRLAKRNADGQITDRKPWRAAAKFGAWVLLAASLVVMGSGHLQAQEEAKYQPMKLAAAEGLTDTQTEAPFSIVAIFTSEEVTSPTGEKTTVIKARSIDVPYVLSILAWNDPTAEVVGINDLTAEFKEKGFQTVGTENQRIQEEYASNLAEAQATMDTIPNLYVSYYTFRLMMAFGFLGMGLAAWILFTLRKDKDPEPTKLWKLAMGVLPFLALLSNSSGWILAEMGRQPWIVYGVLPTQSAVSPNVTAAEVLTSMILYTLIYAVVAVIVVKLFLKYIRKGLPDVDQPEVTTDDNAPMSFAH